MTIDVLPTVAKLASGGPPKHKIDGLDIGPLMVGQANARSPHEALYFYWGRSLEAVRSGKWKLHFPHEYRSLTGKPGADGRPGGYSTAKTDLALYDLEGDVGETTNVADKHPEVVARLKILADKAREDLGDAATKKEGTGVRAAGMLGQ
jgi:arylsulfatase A-like enzyme